MRSHEPGECRANPGTLHRRARFLMTWPQFRAKGVQGMKNALRTLANKLLPSGLYNRLLFAAYLARVAALLPGNRQQTCPICNFSGHFPAFGLPPRFNAQCPKCRSLERHRLFVLCDRELNLFNDQQSVLHFAPEPSIGGFISDRVLIYTTADIQSGRTSLKLNIESIDLPGTSFDIVIANHVLEHVDDKKALSEIFRILRPGGCFISMVPIIEGWDHTYENPAIMTPAERERHFGQQDHVRYYGRDYRDRIKNAGFKLQEFGASGEDCVRYGIIRGARVFIATKPE